MKTAITSWKMRDSINIGGWPRPMRIKRDDDKFRRTRRGANKKSPYQAAFSLPDECVEGIVELSTSPSILLARLTRLPSICGEPSRDEMFPSFVCEAWDFERVDERNDHRGDQYPRDIQDVSRNPPIVCHSPWHQHEEKHHPVRALFRPGILFGNGNSRSGSGVHPAPVKLSTRIGPACLGRGEEATRRLAHTRLRCIGAQSYIRAICS